MMKMKLHVFILATSIMLSDAAAGTNKGDDKRFLLFPFFHQGCFTEEQCDKTLKLCPESQRKCEHYKCKCAAPLNSQLSSFGMDCSKVDCHFGPLYWRAEYDSYHGLCRCGLVLKCQTNTDCVQALTKDGCPASSIACDAGSCTCYGIAATTHGKHDSQSSPFTPLMPSKSTANTTTTQATANPQTTTTKQQPTTTKITTPPPPAPTTSAIKSTAKITSTTTTTQKFAWLTIPIH